MKFNQEQIDQIVNLINKGKSYSYIKAELQLRDADELYDVIYRYRDIIKTLAEKYVIARQYMKTSFDYTQKIITDIEKIKHPKRLFKILEQGCGLGKIAKEIADTIPNTDVYAIDLSSSAIEKAKEFESNRLHFRVQNGYGLSEKNFYDVVYHINVLEHVEDPLRYLEVGMQILKRKGDLLFSCPTRGSWVFWGFPKYIISKILNKPFTMHAVDENKIYRWIKQSNYRLEEVDFTEFAMPRRIYRYFPFFTYKFLGSVMSMMEKFFKMINLGNICSFQYWHIKKEKTAENINKRSKIDITLEIFHILWALPIFLLIFIFYVILMTWEVISGKKTFFIQD